mmetsp:Transcript_2274/g.6402  ORF Transcript_2274/g.6402 Transcript_2274/m.6402 type:complete len:272 (-) Transcript_2274:1683-2498(-)
MLPVQVTYVKRAPTLQINFHNSRRVKVNLPPNRHLGTHLQTLNDVRQWLHPRILKIESFGNGLFDGCIRLARNLPAELFSLGVKNSFTFVFGSFILIGSVINFLLPCGSSGRHFNPFAKCWCKHRLVVWWILCRRLSPGFRWLLLFADTEPRGLRTRRWIALRRVSFRRSSGCFALHWLVRLFAKHRCSLPLGNLALAGRQNLFLESSGCFLTLMPNVKTAICGIPFFPSVTSTAVKASTLPRGMRKAVEQDIVALLPPLVSRTKWGFGGT